MTRLCFALSWDGVRGFAAPSSRFHGLFQRNLFDNAFRDANYAFLPYCTGDLHVGTTTTSYDYDPNPNSAFNVIHRGHLNFLKAIEDLTQRFPATTPIIFTGSSTGALGALYNFPFIISRWPTSTLVLDSGMLFNPQTSLFHDAILQPNPPWTPRGLLPEYCATDACFLDPTILLEAHATQYTGEERAWRPFGILQGSLDRTLTEYMGITPCTYQQELYQRLDRLNPTNLRLFIPSTFSHTFLAVTPNMTIAGASNYRHEIGGISAMEWMTQLAQASEELKLPPNLVEESAGCTYLPIICQS